MADVTSEGSDQTAFQCSLIKAFSCLQRHIVRNHMAWLNCINFISLSGACIEDKVFPKTNSLHEGRAQPLADIDEFALKIKVSYLSKSNLAKF